MITLYEVQVQMFEDKPSCMEACMRGKRDVLMLEMEKKRAKEDKYYG